MRDHRLFPWGGVLLIGGLSGLSVPSVVRAQPFAPRATPTPETSRTPTSALAQPRAVRTLTQTELNLLRSLRANPTTAPYDFATEPRGNKIALYGRVGTKQIHDAAIQTAIALGVPVEDDLLIDTAAAHQVAANQVFTGNGQALSGYPGVGTVGSLPYTYPPPLFGRLDDPFFGFEPPAFSYPPWWGPLTDRRLGLTAYPMPAGADANPNPNPVKPGAGTQANPPVDPNGVDQGANIPDGTIDMAIDSRGVATLRGNVPTLTDRIAIGQQIAKTPGVTQVVNLLNIKPSMATTPPPRADLSDQPPPPPVAVDSPPPTQGQAQPIAVAVAAPPIGRPINAVGGESDAVGQRIARSIASKAPLAGPSLKVKVRDGVASLTGKVPTVYEAMIAYRSAQQTPGVRDVDDRLEFVVPDGSSGNPLIDKGLPDDVEPYLHAQIRRQIGDLAHLDRVRVQGDSVDLKGTLARAEDRPRFDAILRSMPILRGFKVTSDMPAEAP